MDLREQLDAQLKWGNEAQDEIRGLREDARLYNLARKEALAERDAAWERIKVLETEIGAWMRIATQGHETERALRQRAEQAEAECGAFDTAIDRVESWLRSDDVYGGDQTLTFRYMNDPVLHAICHLLGVAREEVESLKRCGNCAQGQTSFCHAYTGDRPGLANYPVNPREKCAFTPSRWEKPPSTKGG
jgi:hypothetical protein